MSALMFGLVGQALAAGTRAAPETAATQRSGLTHPARSGACRLAAPATRLKPLRHGS